MTALWYETSEGWSLLTPAGFPDEATLHDLVAREPQLLPLSGSPQIAVLGQEVSLGGGYADIVAVEASGRIVVVEVKLAHNSEARRAVVSQALAYASYLDRLTPEELERDVLGRALRAKGHETIGDAVASQDQEGAFDHQSFQAGLADSLRHGRFRIVLVLDRAPGELVRLVGYLERISGDLTIDLVTVTAYDVAGARVLVPQRVDPERHPQDPDVARPKTADQGDLTEGADAFIASIDGSPDEQVLRRLASWAKELEAAGLVRLQSYRGTTGRMTLLPRIWGEEAGLVTIWNDNGPYLSLWRSVFERVAPAATPKIEKKLGQPVRQGNTTRTIDDELLSLLTEAYREATRAA